MKQLLSIALPLFLVACGQGGGDAAPDQGQAADPANMSSIDELVVSSRFDFIGGEKLKVSVVDHSGSGGRRFLNICSDYQEINGHYRIDYASCLLRTGLDGHDDRFELIVSSNQQALIAQVWPLQQGARPVTAFWGRDDHSDYWVINPDVAPGEFRP